MKRFTLTLLLCISIFGFVSSQTTLHYADFETGLDGWTQGTGDSTDWTRDSGGTPSNFTGPSAGAGPSTWYMYTEATGNYSGTAILISQSFSLSSYINTTFSFDYHMWSDLVTPSPGFGMGDIIVEVTNNGGTTWTPVYTISGNQGNSWQNTGNIDLSGYDGDTIQIRFFGNIGPNYTSDMAIDNILLRATSTASGYGPGNVSTDLQLWLRADEDANLTGTDVDSWTDQSTNGFAANSEGTADAEYVAEGLNFNPVLRFYGNSFYNLGNPAALDLQPNSDEMTIITMVVTTGGSTGTVLSKANNSTRNYQVWFGSTDRVLHHTLGRHGGNQAVRWGTIYALNEPKITSGVVSDTGNPLTRLSPYVNGVLDPADRNDGTSTGNSVTDVLIGARRNGTNSGSGYRYNGDIAEVIIYDRDLSPFERQKVESYLAIKYGVTLGSNDEYWDTPSNTSSPFGYAGTSNDYIASDGSTLWDGSANAGFGYNIFGIARDDNSNLLQTKSKSVNVIPESILTMESQTGGLNTDLSYLLAGNNGDDVTLRTTSLPIRSTSIVDRIWIARESVNDAGTVILEFDLSTSSITDAQASNLDLFIADNTSFDNYKNIAGSYNATTNILTFTGVNFEDAEYFTLGTPQTFNSSYHMVFDGLDDYVSTPVDLSGKTQVTMSAWFKRNNNSDLSVTGVIGQIGTMAIYMENDDINVMYGGDVTAYGLASGQTSIGNTNQSWHHVAASWNNGYVKLYFDGELLVSFQDGPGNTVLATTTTNAFNIGGRAANRFTDRYFNGLIDEVRVFDIALTDEQVQQMVYQEIQDVGGNVRGTVIPKDIEDTITNTNVSWNDLEAYFPMTSVRGNCLVDITANSANGRLYNLPVSTLQSQTAPMPYETTNDGTWTTQNTWLHGDVWDIENLPNKDWAIVQLHDNVTTNTNHTHLGLFVDLGHTLTVNGTNEIQNTWYLDLNGTIDLQEDSQLVQTDESDLTLTSAGRVLRRQEGLTNMYRYNYWGSPVGVQSTSANNTDYVMNMLQDGDGNIQFTTNFDPPTTSPATISTSWLYIYQNGVGYWDWSAINGASAIPAGVGYIHKGPGTAGAQHQYLFDGKPNNGVISLGVIDTGGPGSVEGVSKTEYLLGNPYPSALDAHEFIDDNVGVSSGTLYLWEQWSGSSHILDEYEGGYAILNKLAKTRAYQFVGLDGGFDGSAQNGTLTPTQYLPVGQGFMTEIVANGTIQFDNSQRTFRQEALGESVFFRENTSSDEEIVNEDVIKMIRLEFRLDNDLSRELVLGFSDFTSDGFDYGYDSRPNKFNTNDLATSLNGEEMVIQAYSEITDDKIVDLILNADGNHDYGIRLLDTDNIEESQDIFIYDTLENIYFDLTNDSMYEFNTASGRDTERFKLVFRNDNDPALSQEEYDADNVLIYLKQSENILYVKGLKDDIKRLTVVNILGQEVNVYNDLSINTIENGLKLSELSSGVYIVNIEQDNGLRLSKKITIK